MQVKITVAVSAKWDAVTSGIDHCDGEEITSAAYTLGTHNKHHFDLVG